MKLLPHHLQAFYSVAKAGTVHGAARMLRLTQTAITRRIASLESELTTTLFLRSRRGMTLTDAGLALLNYCQQAIDLEGDTLAKLGNSGVEKEANLVIQGPSSILRARVIPQLVAIMKQFPQLTLEFRISDYASGVEDLKRGQADLVVLPRDAVVDEFASKVLKAERYVLVGPTAWGQRDIKEIVAQERIVDFDPTDQMTFFLLEKYDLLELARSQRHFVNNTDALASLIHFGIGYTVLAQDFAEPLLATGRVAAIGGRRYFDFEIALAWYPRRHMTQYFKDVLKAIR